MNEPSDAHLSGSKNRGIIMEWMLMPLKRYAEFSGRSRRKEYWMFVLGLIIVYFILIVLAMVAGGMSAAALQPAADGTPALVGMLTGMGFVGILFGIVWLGLIIPTLAVGVRRLHDTDRSGWWLAAPYAALVLATIFTMMQSAALAMIFSLLEIAGFIAVFVFSLLDGTKGPNRFGEDPKGGTSTEVFA